MDHWLLECGCFSLWCLYCGVLLHLLIAVCHQQSFNRREQYTSTMGPKKTRNFMDEPDGGWLHNERALGKRGVYYTFPVKYVGSLQVLKSLSSLSISDKTLVAREAILRCIDVTKLVKPIKRKQKKMYAEYLAAAPYVSPMLLKLNISPQGIATSKMDSPDIVSNDPMKKISFATGGDDGRAYNFITYVAKDKRDNRYCHVFDCGAVSDDVLATLGQSFTILRTRPALPPNHPTMRLAGTAALQAAPKIQQQAPMYTDMSADGAAPPVPPKTVGVPIAREALQYEDGDEMYEGIDGPAPGKVPIAGGDNPMYGEDGSPMYGDIPDAPAATTDAMYGDMEGAPPAVAPSGELYEDMGGDELAAFLNANMQSGHIYGDDVQDDAIYGDGDIGWSYLDVAADEDMYGTLADLASN
eukprot:m.79956 g.79956  ORF g.79956 m.79956 type:complete len:412 (+) comp12585_c1_seq1:477-1712(+)